MTNNNSHSARWSLSAFVLLVAFVFCLVAFRSAGAAFLTFGAVLLIVIVVNALARLARRRTA